MAVTGIDYGYSTEMIMCRQARCKDRLKASLLYSVLTCTTVILPAEHAVAADSAPVTSGSSQPPGYQQAIAEEAEDLLAPEITEKGTTETPPATDSKSSAASNRDRLDQVKDAVREALAEPLEEPLEQTLGETSEEPPSDTNPVDARRQQIRELVVDSPVPDDLKEDRYVGELRDEVSQTLVVKSATARVMEESLPSDQSTATNGPGTYQVQPGDSLWKIAEAQLGAGHEWSAIYEANRDSLKNVDVLLVGQTLKIPNR